MLKTTAKSFIASACALLLLAAGPQPTAATTAATSADAAPARPAYALTNRDEGCAPTIWKLPSLFAAWPSHLHPEMPFSAIFADAFPGKTMKQVLSRRGGGLRADLARHAVAALLNASSDRVDYGLSPEGVIELFNEAVTAGPLEQANVKHGLAALNRLACPLN